MELTNPDILLRKRESRAMIIGDEKLDRRELRDRADEFMTGRDARACTTRTGFQEREKNFYLNPP
jgi:hypothetical protein